MSFEHDVFISYPHLSNQDEDSAHNGWVAKFHRRLKTRLSEMLGREARIWRDNQLQVGAVFGADIGDHLAKSKVLVCILSPSYVQSEWCLKELREFHSLAVRSGNLVLENHSRIITVIKTYLPAQQLPAELRDSIYCHFYNRDEGFGGVPRELGQERSEYGYEEYKQKVDQVAWSIKQMVESLGDEQSDLDRTIYLAETTRQRADDRIKIKNELEAREFIVLPHEPLPTTDVQDFENAVRENLRRAFMSIHLLGNTYGPVLEGVDERSTVHLQNEFSSEHSKQHKQFKRLIWIPPNLENIEPRQERFLHDLRSSEEAQRGAELHERSFEDLKTRIIQLITKPQRGPIPDNLIRVYLMCDRPDVDAVDTVWRYLFDKGFEVIPPPEEDEETQVIRYHKESLLLCDATLILYGKTKWNWVQFRLIEVSDKIKGWGREEEIRCKAILRTDPETDYKSIANTHIAKLLPPCYNGLSPQTLDISLKEFLTDLKQALNSCG